MRDTASDNSFATESGSKDMLAPLVDLDGPDELKPQEGTGEDPTADTGKEVQLAEH